MILNTGFGYVMQDGKKVSKFELPIGEHEFAFGLKIVEVSDKEALDLIQLDPVPPTQEQIAQDLKKKSAIDKLKALGLTIDEINALLGQ